MVNSVKNEQRVKVRDYFDRASVAFDTFYDRKRSLPMQWIDSNFRSDMFERYYKTFESLTPLKGKTVMDIGCGSGPYMVEAAKLGAARVLGVDVAPGMTDLAKERVLSAGVAGSCDFITGIFPGSIPVEIFDYAIIMGVMDYVGEPIPFLKSLKRRIREKAVLSFPSKHWFRTPLRTVRYRLKRCPVYFYAPWEIEDYVKAAGFSRVTIDKIKGAGMDYFVTIR